MDPVPEPYFSTGESLEELVAAMREVDVRVKGDKVRLARYHLVMLARVVATHFFAKPLTVYGACYQDDTEPWGWSVMRLFFNKTDAEEYMEQQIKAEIDAVKVGEGRYNQERAQIERCYSVQEYEVK